LPFSVKTSGHEAGWDWLGWHTILVANKFGMAWEGRGGIIQRCQQVPFPKAMTNTIHLDYETNG
jgi:hypothetical protein